MVRKKHVLASAIMALAFGLAFALPCVAFAADEAAEISYVAYSYSEADGLTSEVKKTTDYTTLESSSENVTLEKGTYYATGQVTFDERVWLKGDVTLILADDAVLTAKKGIEVPADNTLTIYGREGGSGTLTTSGADIAVDATHYYGAAIGATGDAKTANACGTVVIHGGNVVAKSSVTGAAGVGGGFYADAASTTPAVSKGGAVTVYNGTLEAVGGKGAAGIGGGKASDGAAVTIYGGAVNAQAGSDQAAAIGAGEMGASNGDLTVGKNVTLLGGKTADSMTAYTETATRYQYMRTVVSQTMYRLYNPNSGEHFYTASTSERDLVIAAGWVDEGVGWTAPSISNTPVYRLYSGTDHHYTTSDEERDKLINVGWTYEGIRWYSDDAKGTPLYRQFNPYVQPHAERNNSGSHNYTTSKGENDYLVSIGWIEEGISWYGLPSESSSE